MHFTSYLSITLFKILPHSKRIKNATKLSVFGGNESRCLPNFLQTHIFWTFDHISRTYNQINYWYIRFAKVIIIFIMTAQVLSVDVFSEKDPHLNAAETLSFSLKPSWSYIYITVPLIFKWLSDRHIWNEKQKQKPALFLSKECWSPRYKVPVLSTCGGCHP